MPVTKSNIINKQMRVFACEATLENCIQSLKRIIKRIKRACNAVMWTDSYKFTFLMNKKMKHDLMMKRKKMKRFFHNVLKSLPSASDFESFELNCLRFEAVVESRIKLLSLKEHLSQTHRLAVPQHEQSRRYPELCPGGLP